MKIFKLISGIILSFFCLILVIVISDRLSEINSNKVDYNISCLDNLANDYCLENGFTGGQADKEGILGIRLSLHLPERHPAIECYSEICNNSRSIYCDKSLELFSYNATERDTCVIE